MSAKSLLAQVRKEMFEIKIKQDELEQMKMGLLPKAVTYSDDKVQVSAKTDRISKTLANADSLEEYISLSVDNLKERYQKAYRLVEGLTDTTQRQILHLYFLSKDVYTMEQIADILGYSVRQIYRIYKEAMEKLDGSV
jgi:DNA-directed RNA polymerase specialized sigma subunit